MKTNHPLFETLWDWVILIILVPMVFYVLYVLGSEEPAPQMSEHQTEIQQLRSRIEALERKQP